MNDSEQGIGQRPGFSQEAMQAAREQMRADQPQAFPENKQQTKELSEKLVSDAKEAVTPSSSFTTEPLAKTGPSMGEAAPIVNVSELRQTPPTPNVNNAPSIAAPVTEKQGGIRGFINKLRRK